MEDTYMDITEQEEMDRYVYRAATPFQDCVDKADSARGNPKALIACRNLVHDLNEEGRINDSEFVALIHHIRWLLDCCERRSAR